VNSHEVPKLLNSFRHVKSCVNILAASIAILVLADVTRVYAQQQKYPVRPIRFVVPYPPGGGADIVARIIAEKLSESLGQAVVVDNRPGASGIVGTNVIAKAPPDGYTIGVASPGPMSMAALYPSLSYNPAKELTGVILTYDSPIILVVNASLPAATVSELAALARKRADGMNAAVSSVGSIQHLLVEMFKDAAKLKIQSVPYKGGVPAIMDLMGGQVDFTFSVLPIVVPYINSGEIRALAVASERRTPLMPALPTMGEAGLPEVTATNWNGICVPAGTPKEIIATLNELIGKILSSPQVGRRFATLGITALGGTADEFNAFLRHDTEQWSAIVKRLDVKVQ
jgi:tripartite-type tricarboxylate transporter receptor subunit TctC